MLYTHEHARPARRTARTVRVSFSKEERRGGGGGPVPSANLCRKGEAGVNLLGGAIRPSPLVVAGVYILVHLLRKEALTREWVGWLSSTD